MNRSVISSEIAIKLPFAKSYSEVFIKNLRGLPKLIILFFAKRATSFHLLFLLEQYPWSYEKNAMNFCISCNEFLHFNHTPVLNHKPFIFYFFLLWWKSWKSEADSFEYIAHSVTASLSGTGKQYLLPVPAPLHASPY